MVNSLDDVRKDTVERLAQAAANRRSPMHTPVVATGDADARIMVLRSFDAADWTLRFHTDRRAPKALLLDKDAPVSVLFYDAEAGVQLRCRGTSRLEHDTPLADKAWADSPAFARRCYLGAPPGQPSDTPSSGLPASLEGVRPSEAQLAKARPNFAIVLIRLATIDWYSLAHTGHTRALLTRDTAEWLTP